VSESVSLTQPLLRSDRVLAGRQFASPSRREWLKHSLLFLITLATTTFAGIVIFVPETVVSDVTEPAISGLLSYVLYVPDYYLRIVAAVLSFAIAQPAILAEGLTFSISLLTILTAHEMGHYLACRYYGVSATLPFFIPAPPLFLAGTFGAFIKMKSPIPSRRALFDIGLAGPLAGFVALLPFALAGILTLHEVPQQSGGPGVVLSDPLLFHIIGRFTGVNLASALTNPLYMSAWLGLLVTSLNLMPVGQLDGGHGTFAVFGQRLHKIFGQLAFVTVALMTVLGFVWYGSPSGFLYTVLLAVMLKVRHPAPEEWEPLGNARVAVGVITLIVFGLCFVPFPITLN
jgi:membrane-associated protease RseP (regulator of RpoE activity)